MVTILKRLPRLLAVTAPTFALLFTSFCGTASAIEVWNELPITETSPANGASFTAAPTAYSEYVSFAIVSPITGLRFPELRIASEDAVNSEGRLYPELGVQLALSLKESERYPEVYSGSGRGAAWTTEPGTYYWQVTSDNPELRQECSPLCIDVFEYLHYSSPVYTLVITARPPTPIPAAPTPTSITAPPASHSVTTNAAPVPPLTLAEAHAAAKSLIRHRTHHSAHRLSLKCKKTGTQTAKCAARWLTSSTAYAGIFRINATYEPLTVTFSGTRGSSRVRWH